MHLVKPMFDIGLSTHTITPMLAFWQGEIGAPFDRILPIRPGMEQHRHDLMGSVLKINSHTSPLPDGPPSGYRELLIAREGLTAARAMADPEGNRVSLLPPGTFGVGQIGVRLAVRDLAAHRRFYGETLGLPEEPHAAGAAFRAGQSVVLIEQHDDAPLEAPFEGAGWRYITFQVLRTDAAFARVVAGGGREAVAPVTLGAIARIAMVKDPAGNWIELSQRAEYAGTLDPV